MEPGPGRDSYLYLKHLVSVQPPPIPFVAKNIRKNGESFDIRIDWNYNRDPQGDVTGFVCIVSDITEQKRAELAMQESEERYRTIFRRRAAGHCSRQPRSRSSVRQSAFLRNAGLFGNGNHRTRYRWYLYPNDRDTDYQLGLRLGRGELPYYTIDKRYIRKDGTAFWGQLTVSMMHDAEGKPTAMIRMIQDITARKEIAELLQESEAKYRRLHESMRDAFVSVDMDGFIQEHNEAYRQMLGYEPEELLTLRYTDVTPEKWHSFEAEIVRKQILSRGHSDIYEKEYRRKDGTILPVEVRTFLIKDDDGQPYGMSAIVRDITDRKRAEEALLRERNLARQYLAETRLNEGRLEAVLQLSHMTDASLQEITDFALERAVALTGSRMGYLAFMNEEETVLTIHSWSKEAMAKCSISDKPLVYPLETTGLWGEAARQRKPIITNDYTAQDPLKKGLPEGHVKLSRHMNVPILDGGHVVIVAGVGNKDKDYDESDVRQLTLLMEGMWMLLQRQRVQTELQLHRNHLEQLVAERTAELAKANTDLVLFRKLAEASGQGFGIASLNGQIVYVNPAMCRLLGEEKPEDIVGKHLSVYFSEPYMHKRAEEIVPEILRAGHWQGETVIARHGRSIAVLQGSFVVRRARQARLHRNGHGRHHRTQTGRGGIATKP